jgi:hypothetical protein
MDVKLIPGGSRAGIALDGLILLLLEPPEEEKLADPTHLANRCW